MSDGIANRRTDGVSLDPRIDGIGTSATLAMNELAARFAAEGRELFALGFGQSPFPPHDRVVQALGDSAGRCEYPPVKGLPALREAVAVYHSRRHGIEVTADGVLVGPGSKQLMYLVQLVLDAVVLVPTPAWVSYVPQARLASRQCVTIPTTREDGWRLTAEGLEQACASLDGHPGLLVLNYPGNPSGTTYDETRLADLAGVAKSHGLIVLSDEIYGDLDHAGRHVSMARFHPEGTVVTTGLSKWCGAGGWRLGCLLVPEALGRVAEAVAIAASETHSSASGPIQHAALVAYRADPAAEDRLGDQRRLLAALGGWCADNLEAAGMGTPRPEGGFYLFPDCGPASNGAARGVATSDELARRILDEAGVATLPGSAFGRPPDELTLRLAYVDFDGAAALREAAGTKIEEAFLRAHCGRVMAGVERLCEWFGG